MCGIWALLGTPLAADKVQKYVDTLKPRGPEGTRILGRDSWQLGFTRLAINGLNTNGMQPMMSENERYVWICNGEIYNWRDLAKRFTISVKSGSDCEILGELFEKLVHTDDDVATFFKALDGVFSIILIDTLKQKAYVGRDPYGIRPLFTATSSEVLNDSDQVNRIYFSSEVKGLPKDETLSIQSFLPGHFGMYDLIQLNKVSVQSYHSIPWLKNPFLSEAKDSASVLRNALETAVQKRMMTQRPVAALLSGGLDSSLIAALVQRELKRVKAPPLKTFSIGFKGSQDLRYARLVADHIGSTHYEIIMEPSDFLDAIPAVIRDIESFDITTVRASVGNWLVSREIRRRTDCKVVFNGDGSDEVLGGYLYFYKAPSDEEFEAESERLLKDIHMFDVLRSDRSISSHGLEARTPFLDKQFVAVAKSIATELRRPVVGKQPEKNILRLAFKDTGLLPDEVLWRRKEAFSDGVSGEKSWYQICQEYALQKVGSNWKEEANVFTHLTPTTAEACYYRKLFSEFKYSQAERAIVPYHWMPNWSPGTTDPSARTLDVYKSTT
jgi:asparagine synthase (glutamine-hydrolysing)